MFSLYKVNIVTFIVEIIILAIGDVTLAIYVKNISHSIDWISMAICGITIMPTTIINTYIFDHK